MEALKQGDQTAYAELVKRHADRFLSVATRLMGNKVNAEDMVQEAFIKLLTGADKFNAEAGRFTTWFYRVVSNRCLDELRRKRPVALPEGYDKEDEKAQTDASLLERDKQVVVRHALDMLSERQKLAITLCYFEELSNKEAAEVMDINIKALESLLARGRQALKSQLATQKSDLL